MNLDAIRSFLHVADTGSFSLAASRLKVMQSTISSRIQTLEEELGCLLFSRGRSGAELTAPGHGFRAHAEKIIQTWDQARQQIALPPGYTGTFRFGGPVALQDRLNIAWVLWMKEHAPGIALQLEAGYSDMLIDSLASRMMDAAVMYLPRQRPGLVIEELRQEDLVLVRHPDMTGPWHANFVFVDWGHEFRTSYSEAFPDASAPSISVGLGALGLQYLLALKGAAYLPLGLVQPLIAEGRLQRIVEAPAFRRPIYLVYPTQSRDPDLLAIALSGLRQLASTLDERSP
jgi:DNA-binding transcriptional LysR family regulator